MELKYAIDEFITHCEYERGLGIKTLKAYRTDLNQLLRAVEIDRETFTVHDLDRNAIRGYLKSISDDYKPRTIRRKVASLKIFLGFLEFEDRITVSPLRKMRLSLNPPKSIPRTIELSEVKKIFKYLYSQRADSYNQSTFQEIALLRDIAVIELLFATGMRVSEVSGLTIDRLDLRQCQVHVIGKGKRERIVPICAAEVKDAVKEYLSLRTHSSNGTVLMLRAT